MAQQAIDQELIAVRQQAFPPGRVLGNQVAFEIGWYEASRERGEGILCEWPFFAKRCLQKMYGLQQGVERL